MQIMQTAIIKILFDRFRYRGQPQGARYAVKAKRKIQPDGSRKKVTRYLSFAVVCERVFVSDRCKRFVEASDD